MGYELKVFIGKAGHLDSSGRRFFNARAMVDLGKIGFKPKIKVGIPIFMYALGGSVKVTEDMYDDKLLAVPPSELFSKLPESAHTKYTLDWLVALINSMMQSYDTPQSPLVVVAFGY